MWLHVLHTHFLVRPGHLHALRLSWGCMKGKAGVTGTRTSPGALVKGHGTLRSGLMKTQYWKIYSLSVRSFMTNTSRRLATKDPVKKSCMLTRILLLPVNNSWFSVSLPLAYYCYIQYCYHYSNWLWFYKWLLGRDINNIVILFQVLSLKALPCLHFAAVSL